MEYLTGPRTPDVHTDAAEFVYVLEGSGEYTLGGTLINPKHEGKRVSAERGEGGTVYMLTKGPWSSCLRILRTMPARWMAGSRC
jgi:uncharacterized cupin superfamily protein